MFSRTATGLIGAQDALVDLPCFLPRADDLDDVTERGNDKHLDGLREHRPPDDDAGLQLIRFHLAPPTTALRFDRLQEDGNSVALRLPDPPIEYRII